ncbi:calcium-binding protein CML37-like isoform X1 [Capsicum galapagoense]
MKLITNLPKKFFRSSKKTRSISRSENTSFGSTTTTTSTLSSSDLLATPKSVLVQHDKWQSNREEEGALQQQDKWQAKANREGSVSQHDKWQSSNIEQGALQHDKWQANKEGNVSVLQQHDKWQANKEGSVSELQHDKWQAKREELEAILTRVGTEPLSDEEVLMFLNEGLVDIEVDIDGDNISSEELRGTFDFFDVDHDGKITAEELFNVFTTIGDDKCTLEDCKRMIKSVDKNGDGFVCFEDFCIMMENQR